MLNKDGDDDDDDNDSDDKVAEPFNDMCTPVNQGLHFSLLSINCVDWRSHLSVVIRRFGFILVAFVFQGFVNCQHHYDWWHQITNRSLGFKLQMLCVIEKHYKLRMSKSMKIVTFKKVMCSLHVHRYNRIKYLQGITTIPEQFSKSFGCNFVTTTFRNGQTHWSSRANCMQPFISYIGILSQHNDFPCEIENLMKVIKMNFLTMTQAWDNEKFWVPDGNRTHGLPDTGWVL